MTVTTHASMVGSPDLLKVLVTQAWNCSSVASAFFKRRADQRPQVLMPGLSFW